jgi:hypothetical protein
MSKVLKKSAKIIPTAIKVVNGNINSYNSDSMNCI